MFNPKRLTLARKRRRLTAKALAEKARLAPDTIARLEKGLHKPDDETVARLTSALGYSKEFLEADDPFDIDTGAVSFRSFSKMSARERDAAIAAGSLGLQLSAWVDAEFSLPAVNLLDLSYETNPVAAASALRQHWELGQRPIGDLIGLIETHGVRVFSLCENTAAVNAFSFWRDERPFVFLNNFKTAESSMFDTCHELGHLVMHKHGDPKGIRSAEREANAFASAFLMPENDVRARIPRPITADVVLAAKRRWRVSAMAMAYRLHGLGMLSDFQYKSICIELTRRGFRIGEPVGIERETSRLWRKVLVQLWAEGRTKSEIAARLHIPLDELEGLIWNLAAVAQRPERTGSQLAAL